MRQTVDKVALNKPNGFVSVYYKTIFMRESFNLLRG